MLGLCAGLIGGLAGIGGGAIMTPLMIIAGIEPHHAAAASLFAILGTSLGGLLRLIRARLVVVRVGLLLAATAFVAAALGASIAARLPPRIMEVVIGVAMYVAALSTIYKPRVARGRAGLILGVLFIFAGTVLSAMAGKGGGSFAVPVLVSVVGLDTRRAAATSRLVILASAATSTFVYALHGYLNLGLALPLILGTYIGSSIAARRLHEVSEESHKRLAVTVYVVMGTLALLKALF